MILVFFRNTWSCGVQLTCVPFMFSVLEKRFRSIDRKAEGSQYGEVAEEIEDVYPTLNRPPHIQSHPAQNLSNRRNETSQPSHLCDVYKTLPPFYRDILRASKFNSPKIQKTHEQKAASFLSFLPFLFFPFFSSLFYSFHCETAEINSISKTKKIQKTRH